MQSLGEPLTFALLGPECVDKQLPRLRGKLANPPRPAGKHKGQQHSRRGDPEQVAGLNRDESTRLALSPRRVTQRLGQIRHDNHGTTSGGQRWSETEGERDRNQGVRHARLREAAA